MRRILIVAGFASLVAGEAAATPQCPSEVEVAQQLTVSLPDWTVLRDPVPHRLNRLAFFDGPPEEQASLTPDVSRKVKDRTVSTWRFGPADLDHLRLCRDLGLAGPRTAAGNAALFGHLLFESAFRRHAVDREAGLRMTMPASAPDMPRW